MFPPVFLSGRGFQTCGKVSLLGFFFWINPSGSDHKADGSGSDATMSDSVGIELSLSLSHTGRLHSIRVPPSLSSPLPILRPPPVKRNQDWRVVRVGRLSRKWERNPGGRRLSLPGRHISSEVHWHHIPYCMNLEWDGAWGGRGSWGGAGVSPGWLFQGVLDKMVDKWDSRKPWPLYAKWASILINRVNCTPILSVFLCRNR